MSFVHDTLGAAGSSARSDEVGRIRKTGRWRWFVLAVMAEILGFLRFLLFLLYLLLAAISFWLSAAGLFLGVLRSAVWLAQTTLLWASGGIALPKRELPAQPVKSRRSEMARLLPAANIFLPLASLCWACRSTLRRFWRWNLTRKLSAALISTVLIGFPMLYLVPRPQEVQVTEANSISHEDGRVRYVITALDLASPHHPREYENEYSAVLGKFNPQGLKARLQVGRYYRLWVVGIRWNYFPATTYPNILWAREIDVDRNAVEQNRLLTPSLATSSR